MHNSKLKAMFVRGIVPMIKAKNFSSRLCLVQTYSICTEKVSLVQLHEAISRTWVGAYNYFFQEKDFSQVFLLLPTVYTGFSLTSVAQNAKVRLLSRDNLATQCREKILEHDTQLAFFFVNVFQSWLKPTQRMLCRSLRSPVAIF